jgi:RNA polymerase sigma factor (sigma-70 family)
MQIDETPYLSLIPKCLCAHFRRCRDFPELTGVAYIGLRRGIERYCAEKTDSLERYLYQSIRWHIGWHLDWQYRRENRPGYCKGNKGDYIPQYQHCNIDDIQIAADNPEPVCDTVKSMLRKCTCLTRKERTIIYMRSHGRTLDRIGRRYGISKERVRQIYNGGIAKMRVYMGGALIKREAAGK